MREVIIYKWDNFQLKLKLLSVFHQSTVSVGFGWKARRSRVSYFFLSKLGVLFVFVCLSASFYVYSIRLFKQWHPGKISTTCEQWPCLSTIDQNDYRRCRYHHYYSSDLSRTTDENKDSSIYASFLLLLSTQAKQFASYKNAKHLNI